MAATGFDTLSYAKRMQDAGFTAQQAEAQAQGLREVLDDNLVTKHDLEAIRHEIELLRRETKEMETRLMIRLGAIVVVGFTLQATILGVLAALRIV